MLQLFTPHCCCDLISELKIFFKSTRNRAKNLRVKYFGAMKLKFTFVVLIVSFASVIAESTSDTSTGTPNVTNRPKLTTTTQPNFISSTLDNIRKFFFSEFIKRSSTQAWVDFLQFLCAKAETSRSHPSIKSRRLLWSVLQINSSWTAGTLCYAPQRLKPGVDISRNFDNDSWSEFMILLFSHFSSKSGFQAASNF